MPQVDFPLQFQSNARLEITVKFPITIMGTSSLGSESAFHAAAFLLIRLIEGTQFPFLLCQHHLEFCDRKLMTNTCYGVVILRYTSIATEANGLISDVSWLRLQQIARGGRMLS